jgi:hypothetical protein
LNCAAFAQCIDLQKITYGGDWGFVNYIHLCPTYAFAFGGDTSKQWNILTDPIDIMQAPREVLHLKNKVDSAIKHFAGDKFFSKIKFNSVEVVYPELLQMFRDSGRNEVTLKHCKAKYFFYYEFQPDTIAGYHIGIAVNDRGKIISEFNFPSKSNYKPVDTTFSYCKLVKTARQVQQNIDPIERIQLEYDTTRKRFYWLISQGLVNEKEGLNYYNQVIIDAADLTKTSTSKGEAFVDF